jgi:hypothetical protein
MTVAESVPLFGVKVCVEPYPLPPPDVCDTSKPVGAVTKIFASKLLPVTVTACAVDAVPEVVVKAAKLEGVAVMVGAANIEKAVADEVFALLFASAATLAVTV